MKLHKELDEAKPYLEGKPSKERCTILEEEVKLLWKKVSVYEHYGNSERNLKHKAGEELKKAKAKIQDGEGERTERHDKVSQTVWKEPTPKVKMMKAQPIEELEDQRLIDIQRRGALLDEEYQGAKTQSKITRM